MMSDLELSSLVRTAVSNLHKRLRKHVYATNSFSITEIAALSYLYKSGGLYPSELADLLKIRAQSISQILNRFDGMKYISRMTDKNDKRKVKIMLTAAGKKIVEKTRYERDEWLSRAIDGHLTAAEKRTLMEAVDILQKLADVA